jgi:hypothetical protein
MTEELASMDLLAKNKKCRRRLKSLLLGVLVPGRLGGRKKVKDQMLIKDSVRNVVERA